MGDLISTVVTAAAGFSVFAGAAFAAVAGLGVLIVNRRKK